MLPDHGLTCAAWDRRWRETALWRCDTCFIHVTGFSFNQEKGSRVMETPQDLDPVETGEWLDSLEAVIDAEGVERAHFLLENLIVKARESGAFLPYNANTPYLNTIPVDQEKRSPGNRAIERRIRSIIRWNAVAMILRANK
jgi:hypothetical protein